MAVAFYPASRLSRASNQPESQRSKGIGDAIRVSDNTGFAAKSRFNDEAPKNHRRGAESHAQRTLEAELAPTEKAEFEDEQLADEEPPKRMSSMDAEGSRAGRQKSLGRD